MTCVYVTACSTDTCNVANRVFLFCWGGGGEGEGEV